MKNILSYIHRPLLGSDIKTWITENTTHSTEYSGIARSMLRYLNLDGDILYMVVTSPPGTACGKQNTGKPIIVRAEHMVGDTA